MSWNRKQKENKKKSERAKGEIQKKAKVRKPSTGKQIKNLERGS